jgi:hypothetical protein
MEFIVFGGRLFVTLMGGGGDFVAQAESRPNFIERSCRRCANWFDASTNPDIMFNGNRPLVSTQSTSSV